MKASDGTQCRSGSQFALKCLVDLQLDGVEFSTLPSGLHLVDRDVVYVRLLRRRDFYVHKNHFQLLHKRQLPWCLCLSPPAHYGARTAWIPTFLSGRAARELS